MENKQFFKDFLGIRFNCLYVKDKEMAQSLVLKLMEKDCLFVLDTETEALPKYKLVNQAALSPLLSKIRLLQICDGKNSLVFDMKTIEDWGIFKEFLETKRFVGHNSLFDLQFLMMAGIKKINIGCTYILSKLLFHAVYPTDEGLSASLENLVAKVLGVVVPKKLGASDWSIPELTFEQIEYAVLDPVYTYLLAEKLAPGLLNYGLVRIYQLSKDAQHPLASMQLNGLGLNVQKHRDLAASWRSQMYTAKKEVLKLTGLEALTPHTIAGWLEGSLDKATLDIWPRTETGKLSTDSDTFSEFNYLPIVKPFSKFQKLEKLTTAFGTKLIQMINPETERLHARYNICGARTGRLSCSQPNLQQLPRDSNVRNNFIPGGGNVFVCADFSQVELRVGAEVSGDDRMLQAYREGTDLHLLTASAVSHKPIKAVTKAERQLAKAINFGLMFGLGAARFGSYARKSYGVEVTKSESNAAVATFREMYSGYYEWQMHQAEECTRTKIAKTPCGKVRRLQDDNTYGAAMNTPVQGGAAEVVLHSLNRLYNSGLKGKIVNCVHDEILIETSPEHVAEDKALLEESMVGGFLDVFPNGVTRGLVEAKEGNSWGEAK